MAGYVESNSAARAPAVRGYVKGYGPVEDWERDGTDSRSFGFTGRRVW